MRLSHPDSSTLAKRRTGLVPPVRDIKESEVTERDESLQDVIISKPDPLTTCAGMARLVTGVSDSDMSKIGFTLTSIEGT